MKHKIILPFFLAIDLFLLLFETSNLSISYNEARAYFGHYEFISFFTHFFTSIFGKNDYAFRLPMILFHLGSVVLFYQLTKIYLKHQYHRYILTAIFIFLPGVMSAAIIVNNAGIILFLTLLFLYLFHKYNFSIKIYLLLLFYTFIDNSFAYLFFSLIVYGIYKKEWEFSGYNFFLLLINIFLYYTDIGGYPTGHFLDSLAIYAAIFSPIIFIYLVYSLYRIYVIKQIDILWFVATIPFLFSIILSLRQYVHIEYYAPFVIPSLLLAGKIFTNSYYVRLKQFRGKYRFLFQVSVFFLIVNLFFVLNNKVLYLILNNPRKNFTYNHDIAKELAEKLKKENITCVHTDYKMQLRLKFYGITECQEVVLSNEPDNKSQSVTIRYYGKTIFQTYVTKLNNT